LYEFGSKSWPDWQEDPDLLPVPGLVITGPDRGQVWTDDLGCGDALSPGPDFRDWYGQWLSRSR
jgi:hypothetical protein